MNEAEYQKQVEEAFIRCVDQEGSLAESCSDFLKWIKMNPSPEIINLFKNIHECLSKSGIICGPLEKYLTEFENRIKDDRN